ncbi:MAG: hypothetical protein GC145_06650 [Caulobacter sp.]|nr:hypothetical protein [Caulobacter sp.]
MGGMLAGAGVAGFGGSALAASSVQIPFRVTRNRPWTAVSINKADPVAFLIDTGSNVFGVSEKIALDHNLPRVWTSRLQGAAGRESVPLFQAREISLGGGAVRERDAILAASALDDGDFIVGTLPAAKWAIMGLDFDTQQLTVALRMDKGGPPEGYEELTTMTQGESFGTLNRLGTGAIDPEHYQDLDQRPVIDVELDGEKIQVLLDTGFTGMLYLFPDYVKSRRLWEHQGRYVETNIEGVGGLSRSRVVRGEKLKIGRYAFANPIVTLGDPERADQDGSQRIEGIIGMELLRRLNFLHHPTRRRFYFRPSKAIQDVYRYNRAGLDADLVDGAIRVIWLKPDGAAARAGLSLSDKITGWRGADGFYGMMWALRGAPGSRVEIQVEREGAPVLIAVVLDDPI